MQNNKLNNIILDNNQAVADLQIRIMNLTDEVANLKRAIKYIFQKESINSIQDQNLQAFIDQVMREE